MITSAGKNWLAQIITLGGTEVLMYIAVGLGTLTETISDTALQSEQYRNSANVSINGNIITFTLTIPPGSATGPISEAGVFSSPSGGTLYDRITFPTKNKSASDSLVLTWTENIG